eukprot:scaffold284099_cov25-Prasinocladus_malaysianus.AAC.2
MDLIGELNQKSPNCAFKQRERFFRSTLRNTAHEAMWSPPVARPDGNLSLTGLLALANYHDTHS